MALALNWIHPRYNGSLKTLDSESKVDMCDSMIDTVDAWACSVECYMVSLVAIRKNAIVITCAPTKFHMSKQINAFCAYSSTMLDLATAPALCNCSLACKAALLPAMISIISFAMI